MQPNTTLGGRYRLTSRIAGGGMGEVWKAHDTVLERTVAVKVIRADLAEDQGFAARFRGEARHAAMLSQSNIAQVHDYGADSGVDYLVMEYVEGTSLADLIDRGPMDINQTRDIISQAAKALDAAHEAGLVHRDVKPANILINRRGEVKLTDFGIARALGESKLTRTGEVVGTTQYLAPEAVLGNDATGAADIYSLAVVAYEMLAGRRPFVADSQISLAMMHVNNPPPPLPARVSPNVPGGDHARLGKESRRPPSHRNQIRARTDRRRGRSTALVHAGCRYAADDPRSEVDDPAAEFACAGRAHVIPAAGAGLSPAVIRATRLSAAVVSTTLVSAAVVPAGVLSAAADLSAGPPTAAATDLSAAALESAQGQSPQRTVGGIGGGRVGEPVHALGELGLYHLRRLPPCRRPVHLRPASDERPVVWRSDHLPYGCDRVVGDSWVARQAALVVDGAIDRAEFCCGDVLVCELRHHRRFQQHHARGDEPVVHRFGALVVPGCRMGARGHPNHRAGSAASTPPPSLSGAHDAVRSPGATCPGPVSGLPASTPDNRGATRIPGPLVRARSPNYRRQPRTTATPRGRSLASPIGVARPW